MQTPPNMVPIDVTHLSKKDRERVGDEPIELAYEADNEYPVARPTPKKANAVHISVSPTKRNKSLELKYGAKCFSNTGRVLWNRVPKDDLLKMMARMQTDSLTRRMKQVGKSYVKALLGHMEKTDALKTKTINKLEPKMKKFLKNPSAASKKTKDKPTKRSKKEKKSEKKDVEMTVQNL